VQRRSNSCRCSRCLPDKCSRRWCKWWRPADRCRCPQQPSMASIRLPRSRYRIPARLWLRQHTRHTLVLRLMYRTSQTSSQYHRHTACYRHTACPNQRRQRHHSPRLSRSHPYLRCCMYPWGWSRRRRSRRKCRSCSRSLIRSRNRWRSAESTRRLRSPHLSPSRLSRHWCSSRKILRRSTDH
jgi:hypothetical protein